MRARETHWGGCVHGASLVRYRLRIVAGTGVGRLYASYPRTLREPFYCVKWRALCSFVPPHLPAHIVRRVAETCLELHVLLRSLRRRPALVGQGRHHVPLRAPLPQAW